MKHSKPILCLDFDGVLHSYLSGWQGARNIPDPPNEGALEFLVAALSEFQVAIYSSRSHQWLGIWAMKTWLRRHLILLGTSAQIPEWWSDYVARNSAMEPWDEEVRQSAGQVVKAVMWPRHKPSALMTIDDRALCFDGLWPELAYIKEFKPWYKQT